MKLRYITFWKQAIVEVIEDVLLRLSYDKGYYHKTIKFVLGQKQFLFDNQVQSANQQNRVTKVKKTVCYCGSPLSWAELAGWPLGLAG